MSDTIEIVVASFCGIGSISMLVVEWYIMSIHYNLKDIKELLKQIKKQSPPPKLLLGVGGGLKQFKTHNYGI